MTVDTPQTKPDTQLATSSAERCTGCGNPLALDQRYCLNCGKRRGGPRVDFDKYLGGEPPQDPPTVSYLPPAQPPEDNRPVREVTPLMAALGLAGFAVILILGVLIGRTGDGQNSTQTPVVATTAATPTTTGATTASTASTDTTVSFKADWPSGKEGYTIELATLPKDSADGAAVETAKADLLAKGAADVGALDSDEFASLPTGNYVLYSGIYDTKAEAEKALEPLKASFPDAQVVEVSTSTGGGAKTEVAAGGLGDNGATTDPDKVVQASTDDLEALSNATGADYEEAQKKLPPTIATPGEAPPPDNKAPGGGSGDAISIG